MGHPIWFGTINLYYYAKELLQGAKIRRVDSKIFYILPEHKLFF